MNENIIKTICSEMNRYLNNYQMSKLNEALYKRLDSNDNEISNNEYLDKFINSKKLEGMLIEQVQHLLGHTKIDTTLHYAMVNQNTVKISHRKFIC